VLLQGIAHVRETPREEDEIG
jgi:hypothetical protein